MTWFAAIIGSNVVDELCKLIEREIWIENTNTKRQYLYQGMSFYSTDGIHHFYLLLSF